MFRIIIVAIIVLICPATLGCGGTVQFFATYWAKANTQIEKNTLLANLPCDGNGNYNPDWHDPLIAGVVTDAIQSGVDRNYIKKILSSYDCVYLTRNDDAYQSIIEFVGKGYFESFCRTDELQATRRINAKTGINIRQAPDATSGKIGSIPGTGRLVVLDDSDPEWARISSRWGGGYVHKSLIGDDYYAKSLKIASKPDYAHPPVLPNGPVSANNGDFEEQQE